jgi:hypothetical protein
MDKGKIPLQHPELDAEASPRGEIHG